MTTGGPLAAFEAHSSMLPLEAGGEPLPSRYILLVPPNTSLTPEPVVAVAEPGWTQVPDIDGAGETLSGAEADETVPPMRNVALTVQVGDPAAKLKKYVPGLRWTTDPPHVPPAVRAFSFVASVYRPGDSSYTFTPVHAGIVGTDPGPAGASKLSPCPVMVPGSLPRRSVAESGLDE